MPGRNIDPQETAVRNALAEVVKGQRAAKRMTLRGAAKACGLSATFLHQIENGQSTVSIMTMMKLLSGLKITSQSMMAELRRAVKATNPAA